MILELAVADAYGACFEGLNADQIGDRNDLTYRRRRQAGEKAQGRYTDDTQMTLAIAEAVLSDNDIWATEYIADRFVEVFRRNPRRGYTPAFYNILAECNSGFDLLTRVDGDSKKGGGAMRSSPCGLYPNVEEVVKRSTYQAAVTHASYFGLYAAIGAALMVHYFAYDLGKKDDLCKWLVEKHDLPLRQGEIKKNDDVVKCWTPGNRVSTMAWDIIEAAVYAVEMTNTLKDCLKLCVSWGGDTDTVATVAIAAASWSKEMKKNLPPLLVENLENGKYGRDYLIDLDRKLKEKFGLSS